MWWRLAHCGYWKRFGTMQVKPGVRLDFTKQDHLKCSELRRHHKTKRRPSTHAAPMPLAKRQPIGTQLMHERHTISSSATEFYSITSLHAVAKHLSPVKSLAL